MMARTSELLKVYLETGQKRTFAGAVDWPGWCRTGRDEASALQALLDCGPRYARALRGAQLGFHAPADVSAFNVVERLTGNATTDFGAPDAAPSSDARPMDDTELKRQQSVLRACWRALDEAASQAEGKTLRKGPRGGGRELHAILQHAMESERAYVSSLGWKVKWGVEQGLNHALEQTHQAALAALAAAAHGELPERGPRGGVYWKPRYFVRRATWHTLDHAWEIEDRAG